MAPFSDEALILAQYAEQPAATWQCSNHRNNLIVVFTSRVTMGCHALQAAPTTA